MNTNTLFNRKIKHVLAGIVLLGAGFACGMDGNSVPIAGEYDRKVEIVQVFGQKLTRMKKVFLSPEDVARVNVQAISEDLLRNTHECSTEEIEQIFEKFNNDDTMFVSSLIDNINQIVVTLKNLSVRVGYFESFMNIFTAAMVARINGEEVDNSSGQEDKDLLFQRLESKLKTIKKSILPNNKNINIQAVCGDLYKEAGAYSFALLRPAIDEFVKEENIKPIDFGRLIKTLRDLGVPVDDFEAQISVVKDAMEPKRKRFANALFATGAIAVVAVTALVYIYGDTIKESIFGKSDKQIDG